MACEVLSQYFRFSSINTYILYKKVTDKRIKRQRLLLQLAEKRAC